MGKLEKVVIEYSGDTFTFDVGMDVSPLFFDVRGWDQVLMLYTGVDGPGARVSVALYERSDGDKHIFVPGSPTVISTAELDHALRHSGAIPSLIAGEALKRLQYHINLEKMYRDEREKEEALMVKYVIENDKVLELLQALYQAVFLGLSSNGGHLYSEIRDNACEETKQESDAQ